MSNFSNVSNVNFNNDEITISKKILRKSLAPEYNFDINLSSFKISNTRTNSKIFECNIQGPNFSKNVMVKIGVSRNRNDPIFKEIEITKVINKAVSMKITPHFTRYYNSQLNVTSVIDANEIDEEENGFYSVLLSEIVEGGTTFADFIRDTTNDDQELNEILIIQVFLAIHTLGLIGVRHNDLHLKNILVVEEHSFGINAFYEYILKINGKTKKIYLPDIGYVVKIIDFDGAVKFPRSYSNSELSKRINNPGSSKHLGIIKYSNSTRPEVYKFLRRLLLTSNISFQQKYSQFMQKYLPGLISNTSKFTYPSLFLYHQKGIPTIQKLLNMGYLSNTNGKEITNNNGFSEIIKPIDEFLENLKNFEKINMNSEIDATYNSTKLF